MTCPFQRDEKVHPKTVVYAMPADFCQVFDKHVDSLYTLGLLLTADHSKADQCFVAGLDDCLHGGPVFREWVHSWARRTVVKNAIRMTSRVPNQTRTAGKPEPVANAHPIVAAITSLQPFERFVFVLSVLEKYPDRECATLLDCTVRQVVDARTKAVQRLVGMLHREGVTPTISTPIGLIPSYGEVL